MVAIKDWSETAGSNTSVGGVNLAEGMAPSDINNGMRATIAGVRSAVAGARTDVASATTTDIGAQDSNYIRITGTTTITGLGTVSAGVKKDVLFGGALTLTHNATSLILPGGANITTAAGDTALFVSEGSGNWRCLSYIRVATIPPTLPSSTTDNAAARYDGTAGALQNSALIIADTTGALSRSGNGGVPVQGTNTNDSASAGDIGEYVSSTVASGSAVSLTDDTSANVTSISLTAGDWDVFGAVMFNGENTTTIQYIIGSISTTSATLDTTPGRIFYNGWGTSGTNPAANGVDITAPAGPTRLSLSATTTVYLVTQASFDTATLTAYGILRARRIR